MAEAVLEKELCEGCGADIREGTLFCYNCGARVAAEEPLPGPDPEASDESAAAIDAKNNGSSPADTDKLAAAATKRKRARVSHRKTAEYVWEPAGEDRSKLALVIAVIIFVFAFMVVVSMLDW